MNPNAPKWLLSFITMVLPPTIKPWNIIKQELIHPKDKVDTLKCCKTIYHCTRLAVIVVTAHMWGKQQGYLNTVSESISDKHPSPSTAVGEHIRDITSPYKILRSWMQKRPGVDAVYSGSRAATHLQPTCVMWFFKM